MAYTAIINQPGYLPDSAEPAPVFDTPREAWEYLAEDFERTDYSDVDSEAFAAQLQALAKTEGPSLGTAYGPDGYAYSVTAADNE